MTKIISGVIAVILGVIVYTQITIFVIPPIGALPKGGILIIPRGIKTEFIDSPDAVCERVQGKVSILCRAMTLATIGKNSVVFFRLPYSDWLYLTSTGGKRYNR